jgi:hypothetical protein
MVDKAHIYVCTFAEQAVENTPTPPFVLFRPLQIQILFFQKKKEDIYWHGSIPILSFFLPALYAHTVFRFLFSFPLAPRTWWHFRISHLSSPRHRDFMHAHAALPLHLFLL